MSSYLHIISFDVPFPPNYGGVIDIFYKIKNLHAQGIRIILHTYQYGRKEAKELEKYCEKIYYYERKTGWRSMFSRRPYIVQSRNSRCLLNHLKQDNHPILFEGLHSCYFLTDRSLSKRKKIFRPSNIEHQYYGHLFLSDKNYIKKLFFLSESIKLFFFQSVIKQAQYILPVSTQDEVYFNKHFPGNKILYIPSFHANETVCSHTGKGNFILYHGNLSVPENEKAAMFLIKNVFSQIEIPCVIAGLNPSKKLIDAASVFPHIRLIASPDHETMSSLIRDAHIHILITFQKTGLKLKLLQTLYEGRFVIANEAMLHGTSLAPLCIMTETAEDIKNQIPVLMEKAFTEEEIILRKKLLNEHFSNQSNVEKLIHIMDI